MKAINDSSTDVSSTKSDSAKSSSRRKSKKKIKKTKSRKASPTSSENESEVVIEDYALARRNALIPTVFRLVI